MASDLEPGTSWEDAIRKAIRSGEFFLACFSREYNERANTYMNAELSIALEEMRARPADMTWFIPILINQTYIPSRRISATKNLEDIQCISLYENWNDGIKRILRVSEERQPRSRKEKPNPEWYVSYA